LSELRANTISDAAGTGPVTLTGQSAAKAWARFDGTTTTINKSENVSSLSDTGLALFTLNYTNSMADANGMLTGATNFTNTACAGLLAQDSGDVFRTTDVEFETGNSSNAAEVEFTQCGILIMGDLA